MYRNIVSIGVQCTQKVYMYRNIVPVVVRCTQKVYMYRNIVFVTGFCTLHVHFHSVCYRFLYIGCTLSYNRHYENVRLISAIVLITPQDTAPSILYLNDLNLRSCRPRASYQFIKAFASIEKL